jgi:hypothetical protein
MVCDKPILFLNIRKAKYKQNVKLTKFENLKELPRKPKLLENREL